MSETAVRLECINCGKTYPRDAVIYRCSSCGGLLDVILDYDSIKDSISWAKFKERPLYVWRYFELLPVNPEVKVSLFEGGTPLYHVKRLGELIGLKNLYVKFEGANPTGSFKDRGMTVGVTKVVELGIKSVGCASTGNTSASLAAYAAKAGLACFVLLPAGKVAMGKLSQAMLHGACVIALKGNFDQALSIVEQLCNEENIYLLNSLNPWRLEGQKTTAYEIVDQLGQVPDRVVLPVGNCGNISAIWKGFKELERVSLTDSLPMMTGIQAEGASPVVNMIKRNLKLIQFTDKPETIATAIRIGRPVNWPKAVKAIKESKGIAESVSDSEIIVMQKALAKLEGIGVEPASAASLAGVKKLLEEGVIEQDETVVCITTGHMLKDPQEAIEIAEPVNEFEPDIIKVKNFVENKLAGLVKPVL